MTQILGANTARFAGATMVRPVAVAPGVATKAATPVFTNLNFAVLSTAAQKPQSGWRWCRKCQGLFFGGSADQGACPAGAQHDATYSGSYVMTFGDGGQGMQPGWRWCHKCEGLFFGGNPDQGACPAGGRHDATGSSAYAMTFGNGAAGMQVGWRWCHKCQGLFFGGNPDQGACPTGARHDASGSGAYSVQFDQSAAAPKPAGLPLTSTQSGNLFVDRNDPNLHWYLPDFTPAGDVDPHFAFVAEQSGQDAQGNPANRATLTLAVSKSQPDDAAKFAQANPSAKLQEIPLAEMSAVLTSFYVDDAGRQQGRTFRGGVQDSGNGDLLLTFDSILGVSVIGLYQDLAVFGKAIINLSASYQAWSPDSSPMLSLVAARLELGSPGLTGFKFTPSVISPPIAPKFNTAFVKQVHPIVLMDATGATVEEADTKSAGDSLKQSRQAWSKTLPLGSKYRQDGYQLKYTVSTVDVSNHVIRDVKDLKDFSLSQTEFAELKALGDVSQRYPTLSRLYLGTLSRTIVVIPKRYAVVRGRAGCAASCSALVDSAASGGSRCKFEFDFLIAPEVSRIEFLKLTQEILGRDDLKGYTPKLPDFMRDAPPSTLQTDFKSSVAISAGPDPKTFAVTVAVHDDSDETPAVANANLFIKRLCSDAGIDLVGSLSLKLDDGYPSPVLSTIDLNFAHSSGTDEIGVEFDEGAAQIKLTNHSPLDLQLSRYALVKGASLAEFPAELSLPADGSASVPLPADHADLMFAADCRLALPQPMSKSDVVKFLQLQTADVQETQYAVAIDGHGVNFDKVDSVVVSVTFSNLTNVVPPRLTLHRNLRSANTQIVIPLAGAMFSLPGTANLAVHFVDPAAVDLSFTLENDFAADPVLVVTQSDIEKNLPKD